MSNVVALIPARAGSKGIAHKNLRPLGGKPLVWHAVECARLTGIPAWTTSENDVLLGVASDTCYSGTIKRPAKLAQDDTPMYDVVQHAVETLKLPDDAIICLLQPTAVFRKPEHIQRAVQMLRETRPRMAWPTHGVAVTEAGIVTVPLPEPPETQWDSVVSVVPLPLTHHASAQLLVDDGGVSLWCSDCGEFPETRQRQQLEQTYVRDGTVYAFWVKTLRSGTLYGDHVRPLILDPSETCELDTEADWEAVQARWERQHGQRTA